MVVLIRQWFKDRRGGREESADIDFDFFFLLISFYHGFDLFVGGLWFDLHHFLSSGLNMAWLMYGSWDI